MTTPASLGAGERLDRTGICASSLCAIHCAASSAIAAAAPTLRVVDSPALEWAFMLLALAVAAFALGRGAREHGSRAPLLWCAAGATVLLGARLVEWSAEQTELALSVAGAALLVTAHVANIRRLRRCCAPAPARA